MNTLLLFALTNAAFALALYLTILAIKPLVKNPAILHWLWLIVLIKLLTPPIWTPQWRMLPAKSEFAAASAPEKLPALANALEASPESPEADTANHRASSQPTRAISEQIDEPKEIAPIAYAAPLPIENPKETLLKPAESSPAIWTQLLGYLSQNPLVIFIAIWGCGTASLWSLAFWRIIRLERGLGLANNAPPEVQSMASELAAAIGLRRAPRVLLAPGSLSPMLWAFCAPARIVVPQAFFKGLDERAQRSLLLHELAHYKRGDHYVRFLELAAMGLYWWFPVAWLVRKEIRRAEELACDAEVIAQLPNERRAYAEMLVHTLSFVSTNSTPALASGIATPGQIEERLRNIMRSTIDLRISGGVKILVTLLALGVLPLAPVLVRAQRGETPSVAAKQEATKVAESKELDWLRGTGESLEIRLRGEIVDSDGKADGAKLLVQYLKDGVTTDLQVSRDGRRFEAWIPLGKPEWFHLYFDGSSADGKKLISRRVMHREIRQMAIDGIQLELRTPDRIMEIQIVDKGSPVEGANVLVDTRQYQERLAVTDKQGIARYPLFADDEPYEISAWTADHRVGGYQFLRQPTRDAKAAKHVIELSPCRPQKIRFLQESDGKPVVGIGFCLYVATPNPYYNYLGLIPPSTMTTDGQGEAVYQWYPDWPQHHFYVDRLDQNWVRVGKEEIAADGAIEVRVKKSQLAQRQQITGEVISFDGNHGGYSLEFRSFAGEEESRMDVLYAVSDAQGKFTISVLPGSSYYGHVDDPRYFSDILDWLLYDPKTQKSTSPKLTVKEGTPVEVFVCEGPNKQPMVNQYVSLFNEHSHTFVEGGETRNGTGSHQWSAITDNSGIARGFSRSDRPLKVSANQLDWRMEKSIEPKDGRFERIELHRPIAGRLKVKGKLILPAGADSSLELAEMQFGAIDGQSMDHDRVKVDADGNFEFATVSPVFGVYASTKDKKAAIAKIVESSEINGMLSLQLEATGSYQGKILADADKPKEGYPVRAWIGLTANRKSETGSPTWFSAPISATKTDSQGNFTLSGIPFGVKTTIYGGEEGRDNGRSMSLDEVSLDPGENRPPAVHRLAVHSASAAPAKRPPLKTQFEIALRDAKLGGWRTLVVAYQGTPANREFVTQRLYNYDDNDDVSGFMHVFHRTTGDSLAPEDQAFAESMKWPAPGEGKVFACAMDEAGKELGRIELDIKDADTPEKAVKFLHDFAPQPDDAKKKWDEAFALAAKTDRKVWVRVSQRFCGPCHVLNRWLDDQKELIEKDYVLLKVDNVRDSSGKEIAARFWDWQSGHGVPFHAIFDASGSKIIDSAGPLGNIGAPSGYEGGKHLKKMLEASRTKLTDEEIEKLIKSLPE